MKLLLIFVLALMTGCGQRDDRPGEIAVYCHIDSKTDSGQRQYCGKACTEPLYVYTWTCEPRGSGLLP